MSYWGGWKTTQARARVLAAYGNTCWLCGQPILGRISIDHVVPRSKGGGDDLGNLRPAHLRCNKVRGSKDINQVAPLPQASREW